MAETLERVKTVEKVRGCEERSDELRRRVDEILALIADTSAHNIT